MLRMAILRGFASGSTVIDARETKDTSKHVIGKVTDGYVLIGTTSSTVVECVDMKLQNNVQRKYMLPIAIPSKTI